MGLWQTWLHLSVPLQGCQRSLQAAFLAGSVSLLTVLTRFLQIISSQQHQREQKHSLSSYLCYQVDFLEWKTIQMKSKYYCSHSSVAKSLLNPDAGNQLYHGEDLNMCLQRIKRPSLNRSKFSICLNAFTCSLWRKSISCNWPKDRKWRASCSVKRFFIPGGFCVCKIWALCKSAAELQTSWGVRITFFIPLLNLAEQMKEKKNPLLIFFLSLIKKMVLKYTSYVQFWPFLCMLVVLLSCYPSIYLIQ